MQHQKGKRPRVREKSKSRPEGKTLTPLIRLLRGGKSFHSGRGGQEKERGSQESSLKKDSPSGKGKEPPSLPYLRGVYYALKRREKRRDTSEKKDSEERLSPREGEWKKASITSSKRGGKTYLNEEGGKKSIFLRKSPISITKGGSLLMRRGERKTLEGGKKRICIINLLWKENLRSITREVRKGTFSFRRKKKRRFAKRKRGTSTDPRGESRVD